MTTQYNCDTHYHNLTREDFPVVFFLLSSKSGGPGGFAPFLFSGELPYGGQLHRWYSHGVGFQFSLCFSVLLSEGFYIGWSVNPSNNHLKKSNPTAVGHPQTQLATRYGWQLAHKEFLLRLTGSVFNPAGCPYHTPSSPGNLVGEMV